MKAGSRVGLDEAAVLKALKRGTALEKIAENHRCSLTVIIEFRNEHGVQLRRPRMSQEQVNECVRRLKAGEKHEAIAEAVGTSRSAVARLAIKVGLRRLTQTGTLPHHAMEMAYKLGKSCEQIAAEVGCSADTVSRILKSRGVDVSIWGRKVDDLQVRACQLAGMTANAAALKLGLKPAGAWYRRWKRIAAGIPKQQGIKAVSA